MSQEPVDRLEQLSKQLASLTAVFGEMSDTDYKKIDINHMSISEAIKTQIELQLKWDAFYSEIIYVHGELEDESERMFSLAFKELTTNSYKTLSYNEAKIYAQSDGDYVQTKRVFNKAIKLKNETAAMVDSIKTRKFLVKNLTEALKDGSDGYII